jgi:hypothetical protein
MKREAKLLQHKACDSLVLSIELFNRPHDRGRVSGTLIHLDHAFEMLLKAGILHRGGRIRDKRAKETIDFDACVRRGLKRAATTQTPRRPIGAGGARGASRSGSMSVITTHALFALKVQRKVSNGVAGVATGGASAEIAANSYLAAMPLDGQRWRRTLAEDRQD